MDEQDFRNTVVIIDRSYDFLILEPVVMPDGERTWFSSRASNAFVRDRFEERITRQNPNTTFVRHEDFYGRLPESLELEARIV